MRRQGYQLGTRVTISMTGSGPGLGLGQDMGGKQEWFGHGPPGPPGPISYRLHTCRGRDEALISGLCRLVVVVLWSSHWAAWKL